MFSKASAHNNRFSGSVLLLTEAGFLLPQTLPLIETGLSFDYSSLCCWTSRGSNSVHRAQVRVIPLLAARPGWLISLSSHLLLTVSHTRGLHWFFPLNTTVPSHCLFGGWEWSHEVSKDPNWICTVVMVKLKLPEYSKGCFGWQVELCFSVQI